MEIFVSVGIMDISRCSYQGAGNQLLIAQGAGHIIIPKLCADSLGITVSNALFFCIHVSKSPCNTAESAHFTMKRCSSLCMNINL